MVLNHKGNSNNLLLEIFLKENDDCLPIFIFYYNSKNFQDKKPEIFNHGFLTRKQNLRDSKNFRNRTPKIM